MFSPLRNRFGIPGVISVIALVFAMLGGAYAASDSSSGNSKASASAKKAKKGRRGPRGPRGPKGPAGPAGPAGPQGLPGPAGPAGPAGPEGKQGPQGIPGTNGEDGETGFTETLPSGQTETGVWALGGPMAVLKSGVVPQFLSAPISFSIPLAQGLNESEVHFIDPDGTEVALGGGEFIENPPTECLGSPETPSANPGHLCIYAAYAEDFVAFGQFITKPGSKPDIPPSVGTSTVGARIDFWTAFISASNPEEAAAPQIGGSWAVTAP